MSRCFPFPPAGYVWNEVSGEALLELIKVRRESAEAEKQRKKEKRKQRKMGGGMEGESIKDCNERIEHKFLGIERSSIAEELKLPLKAHHSYCPFVTSQISKRNRQGSITRIDIQLQKHEDQEVRFRKPICSITTMDLLFTRSMMTAASKSSPVVLTRSITSSQSSYFLPLVTPQLLPYKYPDLVKCFAIPVHKLSSSEIGRLKMPLYLIYSEIEMLHIESTFRELIVNWNPSPMKTEHPDLENLDWLFEPRKERLPRSEFAEISNATNHILSHPSSALCPTAQFLAQADTYALPFTVPF